MNNHSANVGRKRTKKTPANDFEEAVEDNAQIYDNVREIVDDNEGEDLMENVEQDYNAIQKLDEYDYEDLDEEDYGAMDPEAKRRAEKEIVKRAKQEGRVRRDDGMNRRIKNLIKDESENSSVVDKDSHKGERGLGDATEDFDDEDCSKLDFEKFNDLETIRGKLPDWISQKETQQYIKYIFKQFLRFFCAKDSSIKKYDHKITEMCSNNRMSMEIEFNDLSNSCPTLAYWVFEAPNIILKIFNNCLYNVACKKFPGYSEIQEEVFVKIANFPLKEELRELRTFHLNTLVKVEGVVTRRHPVCSQLKQVFYICRCGERKGPIYVSEGMAANLNACIRCHARPPFAIDSEETKYRNYQKVIVQESPSSVPPGRVPRHKEVILLADNIDAARPGDEVEITGIYTSNYEYSLNQKHGFPVFSTQIEANHIALKHQKELENIDRSEIDEFEKFAREPRCFEHLY